MKNLPIIVSVVLAVVVLGGLFLLFQTPGTGHPVPVTTTDEVLPS